MQKSPCWERVVYELAITFTRSTTPSGSQPSLVFPTFLMLPPACCGIQARAKRRHRVRLRLCRGLDGARVRPDVAAKGNFSRRARTITSQKGGPTTLAPCNFCLRGASSQLDKKSRPAPPGQPYFERVLYQLQKLL